MKLRKLAAVAGVAGLAWAVQTPANAVNLSNATPFATNISCSVWAAPSHSCSGSVATPPGKLIIIEYVSMRCAISGDKPQVKEWRIDTTVGGGPRNYYPAIPTPVFVPSLTSQTGGSMVSIYSDPGKPIGVSIAFYGEVLTPSCMVFVSGQQLTP